MKKMLAVLLALVMLVTTAGASEISLDALMTARNYSSNAEVSMTFDTAEQAADALEIFAGLMLGQDEYGMVDIAALLESLFSFKGTAFVKSDISEDYNKIKMSMEADYDYDVDINPNLSVSADMKMGMWLDIDLSDVTNPRFVMTVSSPASMKYMYIDLFDAMDDETKLMTCAMLKMFINKDFIESFTNASLAVYEKNSEISKDGKKLTVKLDNKAFLEYLDTALELVMAKITALVPAARQEMLVMPEIKFSELGIKMIGDGGYVIEYNEDGTISEYCDIEIDVGSIYEAVSGEPLPLENGLVLGFTVKGTANMYDVGKTKVEFPTLTEENSINLSQMMQPVPEDEYYYDEDYYEENYYEEYEYPSFYADVYTEYVPVIDGVYYVPLRAALENAYGDNVSLAYEKGSVAVTSEYFTDFEKLTFAVGGTKAYVDGLELEVGRIILENGVTYVTPEFFELTLGWTYDWATYDILYDEYNFGFYTNCVVEEYSDEI